MVSLNIISFTPLRTTKLEENNKTYSLLLTNKNKNNNYCDSLISKAGYYEQFTFRLNKEIPLHILNCHSVTGGECFYDQTKVISEFDICVM